MLCRWVYAQHTDLLSNREEYIKIKKALVAPEGEEEAEGEGEQPQGIQTS